ncbi:MAG: hypothetical protein Q9M50_10170 [Methylococcales bacterium]|nr:hypothetical protein [Methylococcales bacterium]
MMHLKSSALCLLLLNVTGCASFGYISTADYVEAVFKRQNSFSAQIMMLTDDQLSAEDYDILLQAESKMQQACQLLNDYAVKEMNHESTGLLFKKRVKDSAENCDLSADDVEDLLDDFDLDSDDYD